MFDLKTIVAVNAEAANLERAHEFNPAWPDNADAHAFLKATCNENRDTREARAFSRRVALYARDAGISRDCARLILLSREGVPAVA